MKNTIWVGRNKDGGGLAVARLWKGDKWQRPIDNIIENGEILVLSEKLPFNEYLKSLE